MNKIWHAAGRRLGGIDDRTLSRQRGRSRILQGRPLLRCRLDRHHRHHRVTSRRPRGPRLRAERSGARGAGDLRVAEEQGHRRLPRQLDADDGGRPASPSSRTSRSRSIAQANLEGAKYTLAVPTYTFEAGLQVLRGHRQVQGQARRQDLRHRARQRRQPPDPRHDRGRPSSASKGFELVESSEQGMLAQVERAIDAQEPIVFLGWEPHPMNAKFAMTYLSAAMRCSAGLRRRHGLTPTFAPATSPSARTSASCSTTSGSPCRWRTRSWATS